MKNKLFILFFIAIAIFVLFFLRYDYTEDKQARVDRFTQKYEIFCIKKSLYLTFDECAKLTPEEIFLKDQRILKKAVEEEEKRKENIAKNKETEEKCKNNLAKARLDYSNAINSNENKRIIDWHKFIISEYEKLCK